MGANVHQHIMLALLLASKAFPLVPAAPLPGGNSPSSHSSGAGSRSHRPGAFHDFMGPPRALAEEARLPSHHAQPSRPGRVEEDKPRVSLSLQHNVKGKGVMEQGYRGNPIDLTKGDGDGDHGHRYADLPPKRGRVGGQGSGHGGGTTSSNVESESKRQRSALADEHYNQGVMSGLTTPKANFGNAYIRSDEHFETLKQFAKLHDDHRRANYVHFDDHHHVLKKVLESHRATLHEKSQTEQDYMDSLRSSNLEHRRMANLHSDLTHPALAHHRIGFQTTAEEMARVQDRAKRTGHQYAVVAHDLQTLSGIAANRQRAREAVQSLSSAHASHMLPHTPTPAQIRSQQHALQRGSAFPPSSASQSAHSRVPTQSPTSLPQPRPQ